MSDTEIPESVRSGFQDSVRKALQKLLETKHLYQSESVSNQFLERTLTAEVQHARRRAEQPKAGGVFFTADNVSKIMANAQKFTRLFEFGPWTIAVHNSMAPVPRYYSPSFEAPPARIYCEGCTEKHVMQPVSVNRIDWTDQQSGTSQVFSLSYACPLHTASPVQFLVRRKQWKLILCGRDPIEHISVASHIPSDFRKWIKNAIVAHQSGQTLSGIFMLRTFIEQYWKALGPVRAATQKITKPTGDELGAAYNATLPDAVRQKFPSLLKIYNKLSQAIHEADDSDAIFDNAKTDIEEHFDAKRLYRVEDEFVKVEKPQPAQGPPPAES